MSFTSWEVVRLGDVVTLKQGFAVNSKSNHYVVEKGIPLLKISDLFNGTETMFVKENIPKQFLVYEDEIIYSRTGNVGYAFMGRRGVVYNNCFKVIPNEKIGSKFLYQLLNTDEVRGVAQSLATGTAQPDLNHGAFKSIKIKLPPLPTQKKIAKILSNYDDLIENNLKQIKLLEEKARLTYEEWFLRFRIDGQKLDIDEGTGLPFGWEKKKIKDFGDVITGKTPSTSNQDFYNGDVPFVKTPDMHTFPYVLETNECLTALGADSQKNKFLPRNSLMVSCIGSVGVYSLVAFDCQTNQQINSIKFYKDEYTYYMYCFAESLKNILDFIGSNGATMTNVNKTKFENIEVVMPKFDILEKYHDEVKNNFEVILNLIRQNQLLKESRDILLPRLMTGMIDVEKLDSEV